MFRPAAFFVCRIMFQIPPLSYNDLVAGTNRNTIMENLRSFTTMVMLTGLSQHSDQSNTVAVSTFMYAPQLAWFPDNGSYPYHGYQDQKEKLRDVLQEREGTS